jgi:hypothetical protein
MTDGDLEFLSVGSPIENGNDPVEQSADEGTERLLDYRSLILERIHLTWEHGRAYLSDFDYDRLFAATDTLFDVGEILFVAKDKNWPKSKLIGKLWMYGTLQALSVQQDAAEQLMKCFGFKGLSEQVRVLESIQELRIATVGHPSEHKKKSLEHKGCTFLSHREHDSLHRFKIVTYKDFSKSVQRVIDLPDLIERQQLALDLNLAIIWNTIKDDSKYDRPDLIGAHRKEQI